MYDGNGRLWCVYSKGRPSDRRALRTSYSKSAVSELLGVLNKDVEDFRSRPHTGKYPFVVLDATYFKVRENRLNSRGFRQLEPYLLIYTW